MARNTRCFLSYVMAKAPFRRFSVPLKVCLLIAGRGTPRVDSMRSKIDQFIDDQWNVEVRARLNSRFPLHWNHQIYHDVITAGNHPIDPPLVKGMRHLNASWNPPNAARLRREAPKIPRYVSLHSLYFSRTVPTNLRVFKIFFVIFHNENCTKCCPFFHF